MAGRRFIPRQQGFMRDNPAGVGNFYAQFPYERWADDFVQDIRTLYKKEEATASGPVSLGGYHDGYGVYVTFYEADFTMAVMYSSRGRLDVPFRLYRSSQVHHEAADLVGPFVSSSADVIRFQRTDHGEIVIRSVPRGYALSTGLPAARLSITYNGAETILDSSNRTDAVGIVFSLDD